MLGVCWQRRREADKGNHGAGRCELYGFDERSQEGGIEGAVFLSYCRQRVSSCGASGVGYKCQSMKQKVGRGLDCDMEAGVQGEGMYAVNKAEVMRERGNKAGGFFGWDASLGSEEDGAGIEHRLEIGGLSEARGVIIASAKHCRGGWWRR